MPYPRVVLDLKADLTTDDCIEFINSITEKGERKFQKLYIALPFYRLKELSSKYPDCGITFGVSMLNRTLEGAFTADVAVKMVKDAKGSFALIGTQEERKVFALSDAELESKLSSSVQDGLRAIYCVSSESEETKEELIKQLQILKSSKIVEKDPHPIIVYDLPFKTFKSYLPTTEELKEFKNFIDEAMAAVFESDASKFRVIASLPSDLAGFSGLMESLPFDGASFTKPGVYPHALHNEAVKLFHVECTEQEGEP